MAETMPTKVFVDVVVVIGPPDGNYVLKNKVICKSEIIFEF